MPLFEEEDEIERGNLIWAMYRRVRNIVWRDWWVTTGAKLYAARIAYEQRRALPRFEDWDFAPGWWGEGPARVVWSRVRGPRDRWEFPLARIFHGPGF